MRVVIEAALFEPDQPNPLALVALVQLGFEGRHLLATDPIEDPRVDAWLSSRTEREREACQLVFERGLREQARTRSAVTVRVTAAAAQPALRGTTLMLPLEPAIQFLRSPFQVLVEDHTADRAFLLGMARPEWRARLQSLEAGRYLQFQHGGGVTRMRATVRDITRDTADRTRYWVLFDSDSLAPGYPSADAQRLAKACRRGVAFHCLQRRAIENYIPLAALLHWAEHAAHGDAALRKRAARALRALQPVQRHHYNMCHGFAGDAGRSDSSNVGHLYDDLAKAARQVLDRGLDPSVADIFAWYSRSDWNAWLNAEPEREETSCMIERLFDCL